MDFKVELCKKLSDDFRLMADIYFSSNSTNISLYFSEVVDNANENTINEIIEFLTNVVNIKRKIEESNVFQKDKVFVCYTRTLRTSYHTATGCRYDYTQICTNH